MGKLILKTSKLHALNDSENIDLGNFYFDISQFKVPKAMVIQKDGFSARVEKERNSVGESVETGKVTLSFKVYDRHFIELIIQNGGSEIGSPITIVVEGQDEIPNLDQFEDGEFIGISFEGLKVKPKKVQKKVFVAPGKPMVETWQYSELKVEATSYSIA